MLEESEEDNEDMTSPEEVYCRREESTATGIWKGQTGHSQQNRLGMRGERDREREKGRKEERQKKTKRAERTKRRTKTAHSQSG